MSFSTAAPRVAGASLLFCACIFAGNKTPDFNQVRRHFGEIPFYFETNQGQAASPFRYIGRSATLRAGVRPDGLTLWSGRGTASMSIVGGNPNATLSAQDAVEGITNYYVNGQTFTGLQHFARVRASGVLDGIDVVYYGAGNDIEYDFVIHAGADPNAIRLRFDGARRPKLDASGDLVVSTKFGELRQRQPRVWQEIGGRRQQVACRYREMRSGEVRLALGDYRRSEQLVVDPILSVSTYLGGSGYDTVAGIAVDSSGNIYVAGYSNSANFPITFTGYQGGYDAFVTKLNPTGTSLVYSTYIGTPSDDEATGIAVDSSGNAYIAGYTWGTTFPRTYGQFGGAQDAFVIKLGNLGGLVYSTVFGGANFETPTGIAIDSAGTAAYVVGTTNSSNFPVTGTPLRTGLGGSSDAFIVKVSANGQITYAKNFGGAGDDTAADVAVDASGNAYIVGNTSSSDFPATAGALQSTSSGSGDGFVTVLNSTATAITFSTYLGGSAADAATGIALDGTGAAYVTGTTSSPNFPTTASSFAPVKPNGTAYNPTGFVSKFSASGTLSYSSFLGGSNQENPAAIAVDSNGSAYVTGTSLSNDFPTTPGALKRTRSISTNYYTQDADVFMVQVAPDGSALSYSTLYGSTGSDNGRAIAVDANQGVYIAGTTSSTTLPTTAGALQSSTAKTNAYGNTGFLAKIDMSSPTMCTSSVFPGSASIPGRGGSFSFNLTIPPGCPWDAAADSFITLNGVTHGMGSTSPIAITGSVPVNNNTSNSQTGAVRIDGATFTINQDAGSCTDPVFSPTMAAFDMNGGLRTIGITLPSPCSWSVVSSAPWLSVTNNPTGTGMGNTTVFASANSFSARTATLTIATKTITITQSGSTCTAVATASGTSFPGAGGTGVVHLTTNSSSCNWSSYSISPWIQVTGSGQGSGSASFIVAGNPGTAPRSGQILVADQTITITQSGGPSGAIASYTASIFAGIPYASGATGDGGPATAASLNAPEGLAFDPTTGNTYIADNGNGRIRVVTPDGKINTFAGGGGSTAENVAPTTASLSPIAVAVDSSGAVYTTDGSRVRKIAQNLINTVAGGTTPGFSGDNGPATSALLRTPNGLAVDQSGNIFISDTGNSRVREVSGGTINTVAGGGSNGLGDGGPATSAALTNPLEIALDASGNLFIADVNYNRIRKVSNGVITTVAGGGAGGNGGQATSASLSYPTGVAVDLLGNLYLSEQYNNSVRRVDTSGIISSIWMRPYSTTATYLVTDSFGNLYVSMQSANVVYKLTPVPTFCSFAVAPTAAESGAGGALTIPVTTTGGCGWSATSDLPWVSVATAAGTGGGNALFTVAANTGAARSGIVYIAGQAVTITQSAAPLGFFPITPCRAVDTRASQGKTGAFGPPNLGAYSGRDFPLLSSACAIPSSAQAYSLNFTVVPPGPLDFLSAWPTNQPFPGVSTLNTPDGSTIANAAIVPAGLNGAITATAGEATDLIIDVNGYFDAPNGQELAFYAVTPCRVADTRASQGKTGAYGPPSLSPYTGRDFPIVASGCGVPASAQAYALNITAVPSGPLDFLSAWPAGHVFPGVSTLNSTHGNTIANAAIVPAGNNGAITVSAGNPTDVVVDVNGYFAPPGMPGALNFYPITPCRAADTRASQGKTGAFGPPGLTGYNGRDFPLPSSGCNIPTTAKAYALNITVVPQGPLDFLSIWPAGQTYPGVSTLNSPKGNVIANMAIVPAGNNGAVTIVVGNPADVIIDVNGYFAP